jgi:4-amino-4-deoxy-L-arabinose transferase-like glycosyltransferase
VLMLPLSNLLYGDRLPGLFAGLLWVGAMRLMPQWDTSCTILALILFVLVTAGAWRLRWIAGGAIAGAATLLNPASILVLLPWLAFLFRWRRVPLRQALGRAAVVLALVALANLPWLARNYRIWHAPVLRTNFGFTLYSSNNPCAQSSLYENARSGCYQLTHPVVSPIEIRLLQTLGEVEYDRRRTADAIAWIRSHTDRFRELTVARFIEFWFTNPGIAPRAAYAIWLITLLSIPGIIRMVRRKEPSVLFVTAVWLLYPLMFYVVVSCDRYRFPILWTSMLPAGYWVAGLARDRRWGTGPASDKIEARTRRAKPGRRAS